MEKGSMVLDVQPAAELKAQSETSGKSCWEYAPATEEEALRLLEESPLLYNGYRALNGEWKQRFLDFCEGKKSLPLTYDPFFKRIFHPDIHPDRLSRLVSSILGVTVRVLRLLPNEDSMIDGGTLLIMDLLGELEDGSLINVEIQKQGYAFPAERISCYSADLVMRQYARVKGVKGKMFTYRDIKKVYVIVLFEKSAKIFHKRSPVYLHHGKTVFDTGLNLELLEEYFLIALDVFREFPYSKIKSEQSAWLSLLTTESLGEAGELIEEYPWLEEIYEEIAMLRQRPEEVLGMFSEALKILDQNTIKYMIEELQKELDEKDALLEAKEAAIQEAEREKKAAIQEVEKEKKAAIQEAKEKEDEIAELKRQLEYYKRQ